MDNTMKLVDKVSTQVPKCNQVRTNHQEPQDLHDITDFAQKKAEGSNGASDRYENRRPQNDQQVLTGKHGRSVREEQVKLRGVLPNRIAGECQEPGEGTIEAGAFWFR